MKIGVFDSGLGGLAIARAIMKRLPDFDYLYLGDTKRVPYGGRSQETIHEFTSQALNYMFDCDCQIVILACNTASAEALRKSQREYLPAHFPSRRVLGMIIPTAEACFESGDAQKVGVLATASTVESNAYQRELLRICPTVDVFQVAAPLIVPLMENDGSKYLAPILDDYLQPMIDAGVDRLVLGCTHYCLLKKHIRDRVSMPVISQDEVIPEKLADYLYRHPEILERLDRSGICEYHVTDLTTAYANFAYQVAGGPISLQRVSLG